ncbi:MAG TPA: hypothetical protein VNF47_16020 [Streptosporangiaceae bacterium]|nr:hypothetical protein [Streptosporangiaceae bacterium]
MHDAIRPVQVSARQVPDLSSDAAARAVAAIGLMAVGIIHALQIPGQISGAAWLTAGFALLAVTAPSCALWLLARPGPLSWLAGGLLCLGTMCGYVLTRSVPLPGDQQDVGNWLEPMGMAAVITEGIVTVLALLVLMARPSGLLSARLPGLRTRTPWRRKPGTGTAHRLSRCPGTPARRLVRAPAGDARRQRSPIALASSARPILDRPGRSRRLAIS